MRKILMLAAVIAVTITNAFSQTNDKWKLKLGYNVSSPVGSFKNDFIGKTSFRGGTGELTYTLNPRFSLGLASGFQDYYQKYDRQVYQTQANEHISAVLTNSMQVIPVLFKGTFYPIATTTSPIRPFVSVGAGLNVIDYKQYLGEFPNAESSAAFAAQAGIGVLVPFSKNNTGNGFTLGGTYNYGAYNKNGISNLNSVGINAGVVFNLK